MESVKEKHAAIQQSLITLKEAIDLLSNPKYEEIYSSLRDSSIQRFEYSIDTFWKFLKDYMQEKLGVKFEQVSPRAVLRKALEANLLNEKELALLIESLEYRNITSHSYNERIAEIIIAYIPKSYVAMKQIIDRTAL